MSRQQKNINLEPRETAALLIVSGAGAITLGARTADVTSVAFVTDGTNGQVILSFEARATATYVPSGQAEIAGPIPGILAPITLLAGSYTFAVWDAATPSVVNLATTAATIYLKLGATLPS